MPTLFTHAAVAFTLATKAKGLQLARQRLLLAACIVCAILPDIDYFGLALGIQYNSLFGHRGFTHSLFFAALVAALLAWLFRRRGGEAPGAFPRLALLFFSVTASHGLLDSLTDGGEGVAFLSPFSNQRFFSPYRPVLVSPLGIAAFFGKARSLLVLLSELLLLVLPLGLALHFREFWKRARARKLLSAALLAVWTVSLWLLNGLHPLGNISTSMGRIHHPPVSLFEKQYDNADILSRIPSSRIPEGELITSFSDFLRRGLLGRRLEAEGLEEHWASGFFPNWFGGVAGRWQDSAPELLLRTFLGFGVPDFHEIQELLQASVRGPRSRDFLFRLAPSEKYDLARADYRFTATRSLLKQTHNAPQLPMYWFGICNGMAGASRWYKEPFREVEVINPNGFRIRFHPVDVKALLGFAMTYPRDWSELGTRCNTNGHEAAGCHVNAGAFFLAAMNRLGLARDGFIVDGFSGTRKQFYLLDAIQVDLLSSPLPAEEAKDWTVPTPVKFLAPVRFRLELVSTLLREKDGDRPDPERGPGHYRKVGRVLAPRELDAMIALDEYHEVIGGAWLSGGDIPDLISFYGPQPAVDEQERLKLNKDLSWPMIRSIYRESIRPAGQPALLDLSL